MWRVTARVIIFLWIYLSFLSFASISVQYDFILNDKQAEGAF